MTRKPSRKDARLERLDKKKQKQSQKSVRLSDSVRLPETCIPAIPSLSLDKIPRSPSPENYRNLQFTWCISRSDVEGDWTWGEPRAWTDLEFESEISRIDSKELWREIEAKTYNGKAGARRHLNKCQPLDSICSEARQRWLSIDYLSQFEELFRFRLGSKRRAWGVRVVSHFYLVWYERHHKICPVK